MWTVHVAIGAYMTSSVSFILRDFMHAHAKCIIASLVKKRYQNGMFWDKICDWNYKKYLVVFIFLFVERHANILDEYKPIYAQLIVRFLWNGRVKFNQ